MDIDMKSVGARIKGRRLELNLTQTEMYEHCGISSGALSRIENGKNVPSCIMLYKLSEVLKCNMFWLVTGKLAEPPAPFFTEDEEELLSGFRNLPKEERDEILEIVNIKLRKLKKEQPQNAESFHSEDNSLKDNAC